MTTGQRRLVVLGCGGNSLDVLDILAELAAVGIAWQLSGFLDDAPSPVPPAGAPPVLGRLADAARLSAPSGPLADAWFVNAIGSPGNHARRAAIIAGTGLAEARFATLVHPRASVAQSARLGPGCCVGFGASVAGRAILAPHVWVGPAVVIGHDCRIDRAAILAPRATLSGGVNVGAGAYVGSCAAIRQGVSVGAGALVGLGSVVLRDVPAEEVVVGNPARQLSRRGQRTPDAV